MAVPGPPLDRVFLNGEGLSTGYPQVWRSFKEATLRGSEKATHADCVVFGESFSGRSDLLFSESAKGSPNKTEMPQSKFFTTHDHERTGDQYSVPCLGG